MQTQPITDEQIVNLPPPLPSQKIGRYKVIGQLGAGGMGVVYEVIDEQGLMWALKKCHPDHPDAAQRFRREYLVLKALDHPAIPKVNQYGRCSDGAPFYTMEICRGLDLRQAVRRSPAIVLPLLRQLAGVMVYLERQGVVHRDIKPENVIITRQGLKLVDFGLAQDNDRDTRITEIGIVVGSPTYIAPEQIKDGAPASHKTDMYAFGVVAYEMIEGRPPFKADSTVALVYQHVFNVPPAMKSDNVSDGIKALIMLLLSKDPDHRPSIRPVLQNLDLELSI